MLPQGLADLLGRAVSFLRDGTLKFLLRLGEKEIWETIGVKQQDVTPPREIKLVSSIVFLSHPRCEYNLS